MGKEVLTLTSYICTTLDRGSYHGSMVRFTVKGIATQSGLEESEKKNYPTLIIIRRRQLILNQDYRHSASV